MAGVYDFDTVVNRRGTGSLKWDVAENELPMWVADMDFPAAPEIRQAVRTLAESGVYGYSVVREDWAAAIGRWWETRYRFPLRPEWLAFCTGVIPAVSAAVRRLTAVGEKVLVQTPVYPIFFNSIRNNGRQVAENPLRYEEETGTYAVDFDDLERKLADPLTTLMLLCNPQNPTGQIWSRETLGRIGELCRAHHVTVLSDEIHCDLTDPGRAYVPFASVSDACREHSVTCLAPTKTFNLAGLQTAAVMIPEENLRGRMIRALNTDEVAEPNFFAAEAAAAAYTAGGPWLDELRKYLYGNKQRARTVIGGQIPGIRVLPSEATYLLWLDCGRLTPEAGRFAGFLRRETGLYLSDGAPFGGNGARFLRMNIACPRRTLEDGLCRLQAGAEAFARRADNGKETKA